MGSRARSVPEYLLLRYDGKTRTLNALSFATMTVFSSGISLYGLAILLESLLKWSFNSSILIAAGIVMAYIFLGGLTSAIYNEVLQFFLIVLGIAPGCLHWPAKFRGVAEFFDRASTQNDSRVAVHGVRD